MVVQNKYEMVYKIINDDHSTLPESSKISCV